MKKNKGCKTAQIQWTRKFIIDKKESIVRSRNIWEREERGTGCSNQQFQGADEMAW